jgi:hypothetical protein
MSPLNVLLFFVPFAGISFLGGPQDNPDEQDGYDGAEYERGKQ